jgi:quinoprotein glucose dehydrogenase
VVRAEALDALAHWSKPSGRDRVTGLWRPLAERRADPARTALASDIRTLLVQGPETVAAAAARAAAALEIHEAEPALTHLATTEGGASSVRSAALRALADLHPPDLLATVKVAALSSTGGVRSTAIDILARESPADAIPALRAVLESGSTRERQAAFDTLAKVPGEDAAGLLGTWLDRLRDGQVAPETRLELIEASEGRPEPSLKAKLADLLAARAALDPLTPYRDTLTGGDRRSGSRVFFSKSEVYCLRCHKIRGNGGEVGPDLTGLGAKKDREYLLQAIVVPNHAIAEGFETRVLALKDGQVVAGIVKKDDGHTLMLITPEAKTLEIARDRVEEERRGDSAMPADLVQKLSKRELRDLIEFLATGR